ncbi:efflux transporter outer membrane subunit [Rhizorhapis sp. SPR117]|uniref:efflux transporter outer membrane subunit n=1 Tax=Rhizorhapis sp. SPR117 TaxID=2912611 RepID=UPI001F022C85|nr:efflux transporter outer membrane subunit [Rhizorhapis sp. SPR117]
MRIQDPREGRLASVRTRRSKTGWRITHMAPISAAVLAALALGGCVVGPDFQPPKPDVPAAWSASGAGPESSAITQTLQQPEWWAAFKDPTLTSLIDRAATANPDLRLAALRIQEARAQRAVVGAVRLPSLNAAGSWQEQRLSENTPTGRLFGLAGDIPGLANSPSASVSNPYGQFQLGFDAVWELDLFGGIRRSIEAADADAAAAIEDWRGVEVALFGEVARAYIDLRGTQLKRAVARENLATARDLLRIAKRRRILGLSSEIDVSRAAAQASLIEAQLPLLEQQVVADINELSRLINREPGALRTELESPQPVPPVPPEIAVGLPAELVCRRPDIRSAEKRLHAATARQGVAIADRFPRLTLTAAGGYQAQDLTNLLDWASRFGVIGPQLALPLFDAGRRRAKVQVATYRTQAATVDYGRTVLNALHEVDGALTAYADEQQRRASIVEAVSQNRAAVRLARLRYENGLDSILGVLDAERTLHEGEALLADSTTAISISLVALYKALGGGWDGSENAVNSCAN